MAHFLLIVGGIVGILAVTFVAGAVYGRYMVKDSIEVAVLDAIAKEAKVSGK